MLFSLLKDRLVISFEYKFGNNLYYCRIYITALIVINRVTSSI